MAFFHLAVLRARVEVSIFLAFSPAIVARERAVCSCLVAIALQKGLDQHLTMGMLSPLMRYGKPK